MEFEVGKSYNFLLGNEVRSGVVSIIDDTYVHINGGSWCARWGYDTAIAFNNKAQGQEHI